MSTFDDKLNFLRKEVEESILDLFKSGKIYVNSEEAPVEDNFEWIGEIHTTHDDPKFFDLMATVYEENPHDEGFIEKRRQPLYEMGIETLCAVADNLFV